MNSYLIKLILGTLVFLNPLIGYLSKNNLKVLSYENLKLVIYSEIALFILFLIIGTVLFIVLRKLFNKNLDTFFYLGVFYYFFHFYEPLRNNLNKLSYLKFLNDTNELSIIILFLLLILFYFFYSINYFFRKLIIRSFIFLFIINLFYYQYPNITFIYDNKIQNNHNFEKEFIKNNEEFINSTFKKRNVYFIILDGMMSLKLAQKNNVIRDMNYEIEKLNKLKLTYINNSISSYNFTHTTIDSIWNLDYFDKSISLDFDYEGFPKTQHRAINSNYQIPLIAFLTNFNVNFYWLDNMMFECIDTQDAGLFDKKVGWKCLDKQKNSKFIQLISTRFKSTPLIDLSTKLFISEKKIVNEKTRGQLNMSKLRKLDFKLDKNLSNFVFIHNMSPHWPFSLNKDCTERLYKEWAQLKFQYDGYKSSYLCMLKEINNFMEYINNFDPEAVVVIQADHGWIIREESIQMKKNQIYDRASIFNAIKAPKECDLQNVQPQNNVNTIRFILNCVYGQNLDYRENIHYEKTWGKEYYHVNKNDLKVHIHLFNQ